MSDRINQNGGCGAQKHNAVPGFRKIPCADSIANHRGDATVVYTNSRQPCQTRWRAVRRDQHQAAVAACHAAVGYLDDNTRSIALMEADYTRFLLHGDVRKLAYPVQHALADQTVLKAEAGFAVSGVIRQTKAVAVGEYGESLDSRD